MSEITEERKLTLREVAILRYALAGGGAFCNHGKDVKLLTIPLFGRTGEIVGQEEIWALFLENSPAKLFHETVVSRVRRKGILSLQERLKQEVSAHG